MFADQWAELEEIMTSGARNALKKERNERMNKEINVLYYCDGKACGPCRGDGCKLTSDINHSIHKDDLDGRFFMAVDGEDRLIFFETDKKAR